MARENVGEIKCPACLTVQPLRRDKKGKLYVNCNNCGILQFALDGGQKWLLDNGELYGASASTGPAEPANPTPPPAPAADPAPAPTPAPREDLTRGPKRAAKKKTEQAPAPQPEPPPAKKPGFFDTL